MSRPKVSFIVLNWRQPDRTAKAIRSIRDQSVQNAEIILVDNESDPRAFRRLEKLVDKSVANEANLGFAQACE